MSHPATRRTVTLCDEEGRPTGSMEIVQAHTGGGSLHVAFSAYVFNPDRSKILMQKRSAEKMLWPLTWANTCCSHPFDHERPEEAGERRLKEELGFSVPLRPHLSFVYRADDPGGRGVEHEYVTLLIGEAEEGVRVHADPKEVAEWQWIDLDELGTDMKENALSYAPWFHLGLRMIVESPAVTWKNE